MYQLLLPDLFLVSLRFCCSLFTITVIYASTLIINEQRLGIFLFCYNLRHFLCSSFKIVVRKCAHCSVNLVVVLTVFLESFCIKYLLVLICTYSLIRFSSYFLNVNNEFFNAVFITESAINIDRIIKRTFCFSFESTSKR